MSFARCLMVLYSCEKFHNNISNGFQLIEQIRVHNRKGYVQSSKGNNSKSRQTRVTMCCACHLIVLYTCVKFRKNISDGFRVTERTWMMAVLTDGRTDILTRWYLWGYPFDLSLIISNPTMQIFNPTMSILTPQGWNKCNEPHYAKFYSNPNPRMSCGHVRTDEHLKFRTV